MFTLLAVHLFFVSGTLSLEIPIWRLGWPIFVVITHVCVCLSLSLLKTLIERKNESWAYVTQLASLILFSLPRLLEVSIHKRLYLRHSKYVYARSILFSRSL